MPPWVAWFLVPLVVRAQSGDAEQSTDLQQEEDSESRLSCTSDISVHWGNSLTCNLLPPRLPYSDEDDEDGEDSIENITVCCHAIYRKKCLNETGNKITFPQTPVCNFNVTAQLTSGAVLSRIVDLRKIVKPRSPSVRSASFDPQNNQAVIRIGIPYHDDYLKATNQLFEFHIWSTADSVMLGFAMSFEAEQFSHMNVQPMKNTEERPPFSEAPANRAASQREDRELCSDQDLSARRGKWQGGSTSDASTTFTGESSSSTLLNLSSEDDGADSPPGSRSLSPSPVVRPAEEEEGGGGGGQSLLAEASVEDRGPEVNGPTQPNRDDAVYVTMSSFYHSKDQGNP
ncbi:hypothetical protein NHX12_027811 [Muraenolepis orangiensis]|uniref:Uncharacterized protein n=1 Tax=Muraenolepis orangiensis TaxID=630683 RepID=A0A9Q0ECY1_9TELE|nr:hypothetical protein NHX12_027811 [Muraenolepis orangiensis]